jgi:hypothetical protein
MADRGTYVDIFFRNGLKEFEVLPPPDIWNNIKPVIRKRQRTLTLYRSAAAAAILFSLSAFSYWLTREFSKDFFGQAISLNQEVTPEGYYVTRDKPADLQESLNTLAGRSEIPVSESVKVITKPEDVYNLMPSGELFNTRISAVGLQKSTKPLLISGLPEGNPASDAIQNIDFNPDNTPSSGTAHDLNKWSISALATPTYFSSVSFGKNEASADLVNSEKSAVSYTGGLGFSYNLNKRISIQTGLYYSSVGQEVNDINSYVGFHEYGAKSGSEFGIQTSAGVIISTNSDIFFRDNISSRVMTIYTSDLFDPEKTNLTYLNNSVIQNFNYLEMPVLFKFKAIDRKLDLSFIGGLSYNMLVGNSAFAYVDGTKYIIGKTEGLNPINFSSSFGFGFEYNLSGKVSLNFEPTVRYYLTPIGGLIGSSIHPYSFGIFSGISYKF